MSVPTVHVLDTNVLLYAPESLYAFPDSEVVVPIVVVEEIDLSKQHFWRGNMGDFKSRLRHERPPVDLPE